MLQARFFLVLMLSSLMTFVMSSISHAPPNQEISNSSDGPDPGAPVENLNPDSGKIPCKSEGSGNDTVPSTQRDAISPPSYTPEGKSFSTPTPNVPDVSSGEPNGTVQSPNGSDAPGDKPDEQGDDYVSPSAPRGQRQGTPLYPQTSSEQPDVSSPTSHAPSQELPSHAQASGSTEQSVPQEVSPTPNTGVPGVTSSTGQCICPAYSTPSGPSTIYEPQVETGSIDSSPPSTSETPTDTPAETESSPVTTPPASTDSPATSTDSPTTFTDSPTTSTDIPATSTPPSLPEAPTGNGSVESSTDASSSTIVQAPITICLLTVAAVIGLN